MKYKIRLRVFCGLGSYTLRFSIDSVSFRRSIGHLDGTIPASVLRGILSPRSYSRITRFIEFGIDGVGYFNYEVLSINYAD